MAAYVDLIVAVATVIAVLIAGWELRSGAKISGQTHARDAWLRYLECGMANPDLGSTHFALKACGQQTVEDLWKLGSRDSERYWWFLDIMMEAAESLVQYFPEEEWQNTIKYNLALHKDAIAFIWEDENKFYSKKLEKVVLSAIADDECPNLTGQYRIHPGFGVGKMETIPPPAAPLRQGPR